jgi:two-component system, NtrC family, response regulator AtoC
MVIEKVLLIDDEELLLHYMKDILHKLGIEATCFLEGKKALEALKNTPFDLVITDMELLDCKGIDIIKQAKLLQPLTPVVVVTGYGTIDNAVLAMKAGAFHYVLKPFTQETIETIVHKANEQRKLLLQCDFYKSDTPSFPAKMIAESSQMKKILMDAQKIAQSDANVFINGESGTGKEILAHYIHSHSKRASNPYIRVNCAAIADALIEAEFFGYEPHSFTGASKEKKLGRFELADTGTLLLDEITETSPALQTKHMTFERVGGIKPIHVDVRLISTSNQNMKQALQEKKIRQDLFYRLNVIPICIPPLRERKKDILPLANYFLEKHCQENHKELMKLSANAISALEAHGFPGNIRELSNLIERAVVLSVGSMIFKEHLTLSQVQNTEEVTPAFPVSLPENISLRELEKRYIIETLKAENANRTMAATKLGITTRTLRNKLKEYQQD